jgi:hypothetical protein
MAQDRSSAAGERIPTELAVHSSEKASGIMSVTQPLRSAPKPDGTRPFKWQALQRDIIATHRAHGPAEALAAISEAIEDRPDDGNLRMVHGQVLLASGRHDDAFAALSAAMTLGTDVEVLELLANAAFPGPRYRDHLLALHKVLKPASYLEIGVFKGETLALAQPGTRAIGVDPQPLPESVRDYAASTSIQRMTSDAYFAARPPANVDLAFIDGLHLYEQVLKDFINVEKCSHPGSVVVLHDTLPVAAAATARHRWTRYWCGDVWRIRPCLQKYRPDLSMLSIPTHPSGLTLVVGLNPNSRVLADHFNEAATEFAAMQTSSLATRPVGDVANNFDAVLAWLENSPAEAALP